MVVLITSLTLQSQPQQQLQSFRRHLDLRPHCFPQRPAHCPCSSCPLPLKNCSQTLMTTFQVASATRSWTYVSSRRSRRSVVQAPHFP